MSASREKKSRQQMLAEGMSDKEIKHYLDTEKSGRNTKLYIAGAVVLGVAMIASVVWNSGMIQRGTIAANVNGVEYTVAEMDYYYNTAVENELYMGYYGLSTYNPKISAKDQMKTEDQTYQDFFVTEALAQVQGIQATNEAAKENGFVLSEEDTTKITETITSLDDQAVINGYPNAERYLQSIYGPYMTVDLMEELLQEQMTAIEYSTEYSESLVYDDAAFDAYYAENKDALDTFNLSYVALRAEAPVAKEGETLTEEQILADFEAEKLVQKTNADAVKTAMEAGEELESLREEYDAFSLSDNQATVGSALNTSYAEWVQDESRQVGDISIQEQTSDGLHTYYVIQFNGRELDETATADIRHILVGAAEQSVVPTDEQYATAKTEAEKLLATFQSGETTPEAFGELAAKNSADTSSATNGGQISAIGQTNGYVETFSDWALDETRQAGDTGIVKNDGSSIMGWHVMYFEQWGNPTWQITAESSLLTEDMTEWDDALRAETKAELRSGSKYLGS